MSGKDEFRRVFGSLPDRENKPSHAERVTGTENAPKPNETKIQFAGEAPYHPYGFMPRGADSCEIIWYDEARQEAREGTIWDYKTLLRQGYQEVNPANGHMFLMLYLADVNLMIEGYNLYPLIERIKTRECAVIEQYSMRLHSMVSPDDLINRGETLIQSVKTDLGMLYNSSAVKN